MNVNVVMNGFMLMMYSFISAYMESLVPGKLIM